MSDWEDQIDRFVSTTSNVIDTGSLIIARPNLSTIIGGEEGSGECIEIRNSNLNRQLDRLELLLKCVIASLPEEQQKAIRTLAGLSDD